VGEIQKGGTMKICTYCKTEMVCSSTNKYAYYGEGLISPGAEYECLECGNTFLITNGQKYIDKNFEKRVTNYVDMRKG